MDDGRAGFRSSALVGTRLGFALMLSPVVDSARTADPVPAACTEQAVRQDIQVEVAGMRSDCPGPATVDAVDGSGDPQASWYQRGTSVSFDRTASRGSVRW